MDTLVWLANWLNRSHILDVEAFIKSSIAANYPEHKSVKLLKHLLGHDEGSCSLTWLIHRFQVPWRRNLLQRLFTRLFDHRCRSDMVRGSTGRHGELHPSLSHVLRLDRLHRRRRSHHRGHQRSIPEPALFCLPRPGGLAERVSALASGAQSGPGAPSTGTEWVRLFMRVGEGQERYA